jgi:hypothetical protein
MERTRPNRPDTETHCHCGAAYEGCDHCPECGCEQYETGDCGHVHLSAETREALRVMRRATPVGRMHDDLAHDEGWRAVTTELMEAARVANVGELLDLLGGDA